jgi:hypothetical protein
MQEINAWLRSGKDFETGKALYIKYGKNSLFKSLLNTQGATPYNIKKLGADLKDLAPAPPAISTDAPPISIVATVPPPANEQEGEKAEPSNPYTAPTNNTSEYPKYLQLKDYIQKLYRQIERNRTELDLGTNPAFLHQTAKQILSLHGKLQDAWKTVDYYDEHGRFPALKPTTEEVRAELSPADEIQLLRQSTSKAKTRLKNPKCRDVEATKALIQKNIQRIKELGGTVKE